MAHDIIIIGAGVFGITAAIELQKRGHQTVIVDAGPIPHPHAASTDISKVVRLAYGADEDYMAMAELAIEGWRNWNQEFDQALYHETGLALLCRDKMSPGDFEYESYQLLIKRGHLPERLSSKEIVNRFPAWKHAEFQDGFFHITGGYAESGKVISVLAERAREAGVAVKEGFKVAEILIENQKITGIVSDQNEKLIAEKVIVAAGAWTPLLVPGLQKIMNASGHPVFHLKTNDPELFQYQSFPVFTADISKTGWYGFPAHPDTGVIKIGRHAQGLTLHPENDERKVNEEDEMDLRQFLKTTFPLLASAEIVYTRRCLYCDTLDEHFLIDEHPQIENLFVASGGSGHGFKFAPILGGLIADSVEKADNPWLSKFSWRKLKADTKGEEASRFH